jgi:hypothetical protein
MKTHLRYFSIYKNEHSFKCITNMQILLTKPMWTRVIGLELTSQSAKQVCCLEINVWN